MENENTENADSTNSEKEATEVETIAVPKKDYENLNQTLGSLKRQVKDLSKAKDEPKEEKKPEESALLQKFEKLTLRQAGLTHEDDIELARKIAKETGKELEDVLESRYFKLELEEQQTKRDNALATTGIKGGQGTGIAKNTPEYWIAKGTPPTPADVPDSKTRRAIVRTFLKSKKAGDGKKFYNE